MILKPTSNLSEAGTHFKVFLAGSIEMGKAENWQQKLERELQELGEICVFNPRRDDWDASWTQEISNQPFYDQVNWELNALESADLILFYFSPETQSPITLMELGLFAAPERWSFAAPKVSGARETLTLCAKSMEFRKWRMWLTWFGMYPK